MSKFSKKKDGDIPAVSTASLPDIVFMLLFFFMTVTVMKDSSLKVDNILPNANEIKKLEKKNAKKTIAQEDKNKNKVEINKHKRKILKI